jgi:hypothetical protein
MTTSLRSSIHVQAGWTWRDIHGANVVANSNRLQAGHDFEDGVGSGQADAVWDAAGEVLAADASMTLALDALSRELFGDAITIALEYVKLVLVVNRNSGGSGCLLVGGAAADEWHAPLGGSGHTVRVMPGAALLLACPGDGWEVTAGANQLKIAAVGEETTFDVAIIGVAAS